MDSLALLLGESDVATPQVSFERTLLLWMGLWIWKVSESLKCGERAISKLVVILERVMIYVVSPLFALLVLRLSMLFAPSTFLSWTSRKCQELFENLQRSPESPQASPP